MNLYTVNTKNPAVCRKWTLISFLFVAGAFLHSCQPNPLGESVYYAKKGAIISFSLENPPATGTIDQDNKTITVPVAWGTDLSSLTPNIMQTGKAIVPASGVNEDFINPVTYTVTQDGGTHRAYQASVMAASTLHDMPTESASMFVWSSVSYGNGRFVAVSTPGMTAASIDGINWTTGNLPAGSGWNSVAFGNGTFVAVAGCYGLAYSDEGGDGAFSATSSDGITWTTHAMPSSSAWSAVTYGNGKFVAMTAFGDRRIAWSTDGIQWSGEAFPAGLPESIFSITYGNGKFVAVGDNFYDAAAVAAASSDGIAWTAQTLPNNAVWGSVSFGNGRFVALPYEGSGGQDSGSFSDVAATSADGLTWTASTLPSVGSWGTGTFGNGVFVAFSGNTLATSADGISWTASTVPAPVSYYAASYGNGRFVVISGGNFENHTLTSP